MQVAKGRGRSNLARFSSNGMVMGQPCQILCSLHGTFAQRFSRCPFPGPLPHCGHLDARPARPCGPWRKERWEDEDAISFRGKVLSAVCAREGVHDPSAEGCRFAPTWGHGGAKQTAEETGAPSLFS